MVLEEVLVNQGLVAIIAAIIGGTIPLGAVMFALIRWVDGRFRKDMAALRDEMKAGDGRLRDEMKAGDGRLRDEMKASEGRLEGRLEGAIVELRDEMRAVDGRLRDEMRAVDGRLGDGIKEITERLVNVGDRLSKVEGVMEGMFWSARNQPSEAPREGAA